MIVIADSGSTKTDWKIVNQHQQKSLSTIGFNPVYHSAGRISGELEKTFIEPKENEKVEAVHYYGSGCQEPSRKVIVATALGKVFPNANIQVEHDLMGAARATCGDHAGIVCILGTGSNSCLFDGFQITDQVTNLGYMLGDEGSGIYLGRMLLSAYFYRELPEPLKLALDAWIPGGRPEVLDNVYSSEAPQAYIASFTKFLFEYQHHDAIQQILRNGLSDFVRRHIQKYEGHQQIPIHFIGSVAFYFQNILLELLQESSMQAGQFLKYPIDHLVQYHMKNKNLQINEQ
ncbi:MAG: hypothetical protein R2828_31260 [Saprospiraceae bacterium]